MSAIAGVWWRDPRRASPDSCDLVHGMLDRMADRGGDQRAVRTGAGICLGADVRWTTPESQDLQPLVLADDGVGARRVHDIELAQERVRVRERREALVEDRLLWLRAPLDEGHARGGRRNALGQHLLAEQGIDQRGLAGVELADDDQQEQLVELQDRLLERVEGLTRHVERAERGARVGERGFLFAQELCLRFGQDGLEHGVWSGMRHWLRQTLHTEGRSSRATRSSMAHARTAALPRFGVRD